MSDGFFDSIIQIHKLFITYNNSYMQDIQSLLHQHIQQAIASLELPSTAHIHLEHPASPEHGDWSTNVALLLFSQLKQQSAASVYSSPRAIALAIVESIESHSSSLTSVVTKIEVAGPGFINVYLSDAFYMNEIVAIARDPLSVVETPHAGKLAIVEFSSPNIAKPFTIGHLRSTIIGNAVANLLQALGYRVLRDNHLGDWGTQFGKQIYAIKTWGDEDEIARAEQPVKKLVELYVKFHQEAETDPLVEEYGREWFKKLEDGDQEARALWQKCIDWSWQEFSKIYAQLHVSFSPEFDQGRGFGESYFEDKMQVVIDELDQHPEYFKVGENGAKLFFFPEDSLPPLMILKKDGATLYATRDLAADKYRKEQYRPDLIVNEVGGEQALYFRQIFEVERLLGWFDEGQRVHVKHGLYRFKDKKMSTRKGNVIWLEDVLKEAVERARVLGERKSSGGDRAMESVEEAKTVTNAHVIGIGALKWNDLRRSSELDIVFDWDEMLSMEGNSGPYMLYSLVRAKSILRQAQERFGDLTDRDLTALDADDLRLAEGERMLVRLVSRFGEVLQRAGEDYAPHHLCTYLYELAQAFNAFYHAHSVLGKEHDAGGVLTDQQRIRLMMVRAFAGVIETGLGILGIETVERM